MSALLAALKQQATRLPPEERASLAETLLASLRDSPPQEIEAAWEEEIARRVSAHDDAASSAPVYTAEEVFAQARRLSS